MNVQHFSLQYLLAIFKGFSVGRNLRGTCGKQLICSFNVMWLLGQLLHQLSIRLEVLFDWHRDRVHFGRNRILHVGHVTAATHLVKGSLPKRTLIGPGVGIFPGFHFEFTLVAAAVANDVALFQFGSFDLGLTKLTIRQL